MLAPASCPGLCQTPYGPRLTNQFIIQNRHICLLHHKTLHSAPHILQRQLLASLTFALAVGKRLEFTSLVCSMQALAQTMPSHSHMTHACCAICASGVVYKDTCNRSDLLKLSQGSAHCTLPATVSCASAHLQSSMRAGGPPESMLPLQGPSLA